MNVNAGDDGWRCACWRKAAGMVDAIAGISNPSLGFLTQGLRATRQTCVRPTPVVVAKKHPETSTFFARRRVQVRNSARGPPAQRTIAKAPVRSLPQR